MPDGPTPFPPDLTVSETRAAAYQLRGMAARLLDLAHQFPLPPEEDLDRILEGGERAFKEKPLLSLFVDIDTIVRDELIPAAVVLDDGDGGACSLQVAEQLLEEVDGLAGLQGVPAQALQRAGIDRTQASALVAALDLARRFACPDPREGELFGGPSDVASYLFLRYAVRDQEVMGVLYFDSRSRLLWEQEVFRGTLSKMTASPRQPYGRRYSVGRRVSRCPNPPQRRSGPQPGRSGVHRQAGKGVPGDGSGPPGPPDPRECAAVGVAVGAS